MAGDVLSQNEIDALLSALSTGEMDADELKKENKKQYRILIMYPPKTAAARIIQIVFLISGSCIYAIKGRRLQRYDHSR
ncbi:MAG: hypothetical protein ABS902_04305, partial [Priestia megaterium]